VTSQHNVTAHPEPRRASLDDYSGYAVSGISDADQRHNDASSKYLQILTETQEKLQQSFDAYKRGDSVASDGITKSRTGL